MWSGTAERIWLCLFDGEREVERIALDRGTTGVFSAVVPGVGVGAQYGLRADGPYAPARGLWFDPAKLLADPRAVALDRPFAYAPQLAAPRDAGVDTASLMPKAVVTALPPPRRPAAPLFRPGGLIYEVAVRPFTMLHPEVPVGLRGTVAALAHPAVVEHLLRLGVDAVELMPVTAWIDERHLGPLGLVNGWGYNPVVFLAPDPRVCPGGIGELAATVATLRAAGIGVILDVVFNHTGEGDAHGPTLSLRGLDATAYFRHEPDGRLANDAGTGNTLACDHPATRRLVLDALRHFVGQAGVDGFRFDLATALGRTADGFDPQAPLLREMAADPLLADRVMIAEPWDLGPDGYQLGNFPPPWLEWNDRYRDRVRRFWRGDAHMLGAFGTAIAGSSDVYPPPATRSVNFIAAHDGFSLADLVAYRQKHNEANGEANRDGHGENLSWNHGIEGPAADAGRAERAPARPARAAGHPLRLPGDDHADRRRRVRADAAGQQQRLCTGQSAHLARLGRPRPRARGLYRRPRGAPPGAPGARRPGAALGPVRRGGHPGRRLADRRRIREDRRRLGGRPRHGARSCCSAAAATVASPSSSTGARTRWRSGCPRAAATAGKARRAAGSRSGRAPWLSSPNCRAAGRPRRRPPLEPAGSRP